MSKCIFCDCCCLVSSGWFWQGFCGVWEVQEVVYCCHTAPVSKDLNLGLLRSMDHDHNHNHHNPVLNLIPRSTQGSLAFWTYVMILLPTSSLKLSLGPSLEWGNCWVGHQWQFCSYRECPATSQVFYCQVWQQPFFYQDYWWKVHLPVH